MSGFQTIVKFFNSKKSNKIFTRAEYFTALKKAGLKDSYKDTVRCYLVNAGYLKDIEAGVYRKLKPIPKDLTISRLEREAYPNAKRFKKKPQRKVGASPVLGMGYEPSTVIFDDPYENMFQEDDNG